MHWQLNALGPACTQRTKKGNLTGNESIVKFMDRKFLSWSEFQLMELNCRNEVKITCKMKKLKKKGIAGENINNHSKSRENAIGSKEI